MRKFDTLTFCAVLLLGIHGRCLSENSTSPMNVEPGSGAPQLPGQAKSASLRPAKKSSGASPRATISVDQPFTQKMADRAGLNPQRPELSSDGVRSGEDLASSECLLAETIIMKTNGFRTDDKLKTFCEAAKTADNSQKVDAVKSNLEEHAGTTIDDALIHIVSWSQGKATGAWYHYNRHANGWSGKLLPFASGDAVSSVDHLLGHGNVAFLAIHLGIDDSCDISYEITAEHTKPLNQQDLADLIKLATDYLIKGAAGKAKAPTPPAPENAPAFIAKIPDGNPQIGVWGGETILSLPALPASITLTPHTAKSVTVKFAEKSADPKTFQITTTCSNKEVDQKKTEGEANSTAGTSPAPSWRAKAVRWTPLAFYKRVQLPASGSSGKPASAKTDPPASKDPLSNMGQSVVNEGIYWWDVSVAMPVTSYKNLKFDSQNNLIVLKKSDDVKPYALFDFFPGGSDLRAKNGISMLGLYTGIPLSNQPLQKPFVGGGFTFAIKSFRFQPLVGVRIQKETRTSTLTPGSPGNGAQLTNDLRSEWHAKLQVMIGFSIADARKVLGLK